MAIIHAQIAWADSFPLCYAMLTSNTNNYWMRFFAGTIIIYFDFYEKISTSDQNLPYIYSGFSNNQGGCQKLEFKMNLQNP